MHGIIAPMVTWTYKDGLESAMEQKRIVIDQGSQIQPVDTVTRADPYSSLAERGNGNGGQKGDESGSRREKESCEKLKENESNEITEWNLSKELREIKVKNVEKSDFNFTHSISKNSSRNKPNERPPKMKKNGDPF